MNWIKNSILNFGLIIVSCAVGVVCFEIGLRINKYLDPWEKTKEANILRNFEFEYEISDLYQSDTEKAYYARDRYGLRDNCKSPSDIEILTIGGSTTDQRYVDDNKTYQSVLEKDLKQVKENFGCVSNAGVDGHSTWGHIFSFKHWFPLIPELAPKFVILYIGVNDANFRKAHGPNSFDKKINDQASADQSFKSKLKQFEIVKSLLPLYHFVRYNDWFPDKSYLTYAYAGHHLNRYQLTDYTISKLNKATIHLSEQNSKMFRLRLLDLVTEVEGINAIPICVTQPHRYVLHKNGQLYGIPNVLGEGFSGLDYDYSIKQLNEIMFEICGNNTLDLHTMNFENDHFYDGIHTTAAGSKIIGKKISEFLKVHFY